MSDRTKSFIILLVFNRFFRFGASQNAIVVLIFCCLLATPLFAQEPFYHQITKKDGLPSNCVYEVKQDKAGFIWVATDNGVARFDGGRFEHFTERDGLTDNDVFLVRPDSKGRVWMLSANGQCCFWQNGKIYNSYNTSFLKNLKSESWFNSFGEDKQGNLWFGTYLNGVFKLDKSDRIEKFGLTKQDGLAGFSTIRSDVSIDKDGDAWIIDLNGAINLSKDPNKQIISISRPNGNPARDLYLENIRSLSVYVGQVRIYSRSGFEVVKGINPPNHCIFSTKTENGDIWFSDLHDLHRFKGGKLSTEAHEILIHDKKVSNVFMDKEKNIWVCTLDEGLWIINQPDVRHYRSIFKDQQAIHSVYADKDSAIWVGADNGSLARIREKEFTSFPLVSNSIKSGRSRVRSIVPIENGQFVLAYEQSLIFMDSSGIRSYAPFGVKCFLNFKDRYWIGTSTGCISIPRKKYLNMSEKFRLNRTEITQKLLVKLVGFRSLVGKRFNDMEGDSLGNVWFATNKGLFRFNFQKNECEPYSHHISWFQKQIHAVKSLDTHILLLGISGTGLWIVRDGKLASLNKSSNYSGYSCAKFTRDLKTS